MDGVVDLHTSRSASVMPDLEIPREYYGWWRITSTSQWADDSLDGLGTALISLTGHDDRLRMHMLLATLTSRPPSAEFRLPGMARGNGIRRLEAGASSFVRMDASPVRSRSRTATRAPSSPSEPPNHRSGFPIRPATARNGAAADAAEIANGVSLPPDRNESRLGSDLRTRSLTKLVSL